MSRRSTPWDQYTVTESGLYLTDNTIADVSTSRHGLVPKAPNDTAKFLRGDGTWSTLGSAAGSLVLLESHTASTSATLDFTTRNATGQSGASFQSDYDLYVFELLAVLPATNNVDLYMRLSSNGGSSFISTSTYYYSCFAARGGASNNTETGATAQLVLTRTGDGIATIDAAWGVYGTFRIGNPLSTSVYKRVYGGASWNNNANQHCIGMMSGLWASSGTAVNAVQFLFNSGNVASGVIRLYGVAK